MSETSSYCNVLVFASTFVFGFLKVLFFRKGLPLATLSAVIHCGYTGFLLVWWWELGKDLSWIFTVRTWWSFFTKKPTKIWRFCYDCGTQKFPILQLIHTQSPLIHWNYYLSVPINLWLHQLLLQADLSYVFPVLPIFHYTDVILCSATSLLHWV